MQFDESKHPRDSDGKFTDGKGKKEKLTEAIRKYSDNPSKDIAESGGQTGRKKMTPAEKIASVHIKAGENNVLPELNEKNLSEIGVHTNKPVLIKSQIYERNIMKHDDVDPKEIGYIIGHALYDENNRVVQGKNKSGNYYIFYAKTKFISKRGKPIYGTVAVDIAVNSNYFEVVHWHVVRQNSMKSIDPNFNR